jgi:pimeloyl-ACP methyl ester carboxylesterase
MRAVLALPSPTSSEEWRDRSKVLLPLYFHEWNPQFAHVLNDGVRPNYAAALAAGRHLATWNRWRDLPRMSFPALLVMGRHDFIPHLRRAPRAKRLLPNATLAIMERSGHYPWLEEPAEFVTAVADWLRLHVV